METPKNWNNHKDWDKYFQANPIDLDTIPKYKIKDSLRYFSLSEGKKVWISGCGLELSPWLFSNLNCEVLATDISQIAIDFQNNLIDESPFDRLKELHTIFKELEIKPYRNFIKPKVRVEDFRITKPKEEFVVILNTKAIQGLSKKDIEKAAKTFFTSNMKGGVFIASTMNVQGLKRTEIENAFLDAGYIIPNVKANQWYRHKLNETGILHAMVLGNPVIPQWGQYENKGGKEQEKKDKEILRSFRKEYQERLKVNYEEDKDRYRPEIDKLAHIIYNTG